MCQRGIFESNSVNFFKTFTEQKQDKYICDWKEGFDLDKYVLINKFIYKVFQVNKKQMIHLENMLIKIFLKKNTSKKNLEKFIFFTKIICKLGQSESSFLSKEIFQNKNICVMLVLIA